LFYLFKAGQEVQNKIVFYLCSAVIPVRYPTPIEPGVSLQAMEEGCVEPWRLAGGVYPLSRQQLCLQATTGFILYHPILSLFYIDNKSM